MKKKLALVMAAIMTVAMVPMSAFASTKYTVVDEVHTATGDEHEFESRVELKKDDADEYAEEDFEVELKLTNGKFTKDAADEEYLLAADPAKGVKEVTVKNATTAYLTLDKNFYNAANGNKAVTVEIPAYALAEGDVVASFSTNKNFFSDKSVVIAKAHTDEVAIETEKVVTFVEDAETIKNLEDITVTGLVNKAVTNDNGEATITLKLKGNYSFVVADKELQTLNKDGDLEDLYIKDAVTFLNDSNASAARVDADSISSKEIKFTIKGVDKNQLTKMRISGIAIKADRKAKAGDTAYVTVSSKEFESAKLEVAKMVAEAVTYSVEDKDLPVIYAGKNNDENNTLKVEVNENTGDILNTSRKATFTFPEGIEVVDIDTKGSKKLDSKFKYEIDENVVTIWNYSTDEGKNKTDLDVKFILNAAPTFKGDVAVKLGGEFDDKEFKVATVKAPYTVEAKTSQVLIDYRFVPVNEIVITEAEDGILENDDKIYLGVEKMAFEDAGKVEVTEGDIDVDVTVNDGNRTNSQLEIEVKDSSTEASTIVISGLELYLDRTLPVGGYALENVFAEGSNVLWENSTEKKAVYDEDVAESTSAKAMFKAKNVVANDKYVEVVTQGRDQDDSSTSKKIVITVGAPTMAVGTETVALDVPAYINAENYTELPLRAISESFGATVAWDDASRTVTVLMGQRIISMAIGSKTMYINGTPVQMNTAPEITNNRTFVPLRDLANALGISNEKIGWDDASKTATLN